MGIIKHFSSGSDPQPGEPNPRNFRIKKSNTVGKYLRLWLVYPDCTNYGGEKILVFENASKAMGYIDPHFCEDSPSPIARFVPTERGWTMSFFFCSALHVASKGEFE